MKLLVATARTQGARINDYNWCIEGELVRIGEVCARDRAEPDGGCGCGRGFGGLNSHRATTSALDQRVRRAAEAVLAKQNYVRPIDVFLGLGWLTPAHLEDWRHGRVPCLERVVQASLPKPSTAMRLFRRWAQERGLVPSETGYVARTSGRRRLRFSVSGATEIERAYRTHWVSPELSAAKRERREAGS